MAGAALEAAGAAAVAGVDAFVTIAIRVGDLARVLAVAERFPNVFCTVGTHPHYADQEPGVTVDTIVELARHPKVVGIGEAGLDTVLCNVPIEAQRRSLAIQIAASRTTGLPLVIHSVQQDEEMAATLTTEHRRGAFPIVMHAFSGGPALAGSCLRLGAFLSFGGLLTYPENEHSRRIAAELPAECLLLETDAPSLTPAPRQADRNEPAFIKTMAELLAELRRTTVEALARDTTANFHRAFARVPRRLT